MNIYIKVRAYTIVAMTDDIADGHVWAERLWESQVVTYNVYKVRVTDNVKPWFFLRELLNCCEQQLGIELKLDAKYINNN